MQAYDYWGMLIKHIGDVGTIFSDRFVYPRQLEFGLPGNGNIACNFRCEHCQSATLNKALGDWEDVGLQLISNLDGAIPYHIYCGVYTEPTLNPRLLDFIRATKQSGAYYGLHTNGSMMTGNIADSVCCEATSKNDYVSISIDAGSPSSFAKQKRVREDWFWRVVEGIKLLTARASLEGTPSIRLTYLLQDGVNDGVDEIEYIVRLARERGVDSLRFSVPYATFGSTYSELSDYRQGVEIPADRKYGELLEPYLSRGNSTEITFMAPDTQDMTNTRFDRCVGGYYQITVGADGYMYRCNSVASPSFPGLRLGRVTSNLADFRDMIRVCQSRDFEVSECFSCGARCCRALLRMNDMYDKSRKGYCND